MTNIKKLALFNATVILMAFVWLFLISPTPAYAVDDRYWIGGDGNWSDTAHWSLSDGGAGGASMPAAGNDVHFTANSDSGAGFTVTINAANRYCLSWDSSSVDQVMTIAGTYAVGVYGDLTWKSDHVNTWTGELYMLGTGGGNTIDLAGVALNDPINFNGAGGDWTLASNLTADHIYFSNGSVDTADYDLETDTQCALASAASLDLGASTWTYNDDYFDNNLGTFTCGTSSIEFTAANTNFYGGAGQTYYDVEFSGSGYVYHQEQCSYHDLTRTGTTDNDNIRFYTDVTVTGTFYANGVNEANRLEVRSNASAYRTITAAATSTQYSSWYYIIGAGAASWDLTADPGGAALMSHVQDITFTTDLYFVGGTSWTVGFAHTSGGTANNDWGIGFQYSGGRFLNAIFDSNSPATGSLNLGTTHLHDLDASALSSLVEFDPTGSVSFNVYGDWTGNVNLDSSSVGGSTFDIDFTGAGTHLFNPNGQIFKGLFHLYDTSVGCIISLQSDLVIQPILNSYISLDYTLLTNDYDITITYDFIIDNTSGSSDFGSSTISCRYFSCNSSTVDYGTSVINCNRLYGGGATYYEVNIEAISTTVIDDINTFHDLYVYADNTTTAQLEIKADQLIINDLILTGYNATTKRLTVKSDVAGTQRTLYVNHGYALQYCDVSDMIAAGTTSPWDCSAGLNVDLGNNLYITFTPASNCYWVGNTGNWSNAAHWASTSGGAGGTSRVPIGNDSAIFDANSVTLPLQTITLDMVNIPTISAAAIQNNPTFSGSTIDVYGSLNLGNLTFSVTDVYFKGKDNHTLASLNTITSEVYISKDTSTMASITLNSSIIIDNDINLLSGTFRLSAFSLTVDKFISTVTTSARALDLGTGILTLVTTGSNFNVVSTGLTVVAAPDSTIIIDNDTATACTFIGAGKTYGNITIQGAGVYIQYFNGNNGFSTITVDRSEAAKTVSGSVTCTITGLSIPISGATTVTITNTDFVMASGEIYGDYLIISGSSAAGGATFWANAGGHSTNNGGNAGWLWTVPTPPTIVTLDASNVSYLGEQLNGSITSMGEYGILYCYFEYGPTASYGFETAPQSTLTATGDIDFYLSPYKVYHYRAAAYYGLGFVEYGLDKTVSLSGAVGQAKADISGIDITDGTPLTDDTPDEPDQMYTEGHTWGIPFADFVNPALANADIPTEAFWYPLAFFVAILVGFKVYGSTRSFLFQGIASCAVMAAFCGGGALGDGLLPYFTVVLFAIQATCMAIIQERQHV